MDAEGAFPIFAVIALVVISFACIFSGACDVNRSDAERLLRQEGITQYTLTGYEWFACDKSDSFSTGFHGVKNGTAVSGVICGGWPKAYTIRYK